MILPVKVLVFQKVQTGMFTKALHHCNSHKKEGCVKFNLNFFILLTYRVSEALVLLFTAT